MSVFPQIPEVISFKRPLFYSGDLIINSANKLLNELKNKDELTEKEEKRKKFLHRVVSVIINHKIYNLSIKEAVEVGLLE